MRMLSTLYQLYAAYTISCIGDRLWVFGLILILEHLGGLRLICFHQLVEEIFVMALSSSVGDWLDRNSRKRGVLTVLATNNCNVVLSCALLAACISINLRQEDPKSEKIFYWLYVICLLASIVTCSVGSVASEAEKLVFTKDWIVVLARKDEISLSRANAMMKTIDLITAVVSPLTAGIMVTYIGFRLVCLTFTIWNLLSWAVESFILANLYDKTPELQKREPLKKPGKEEISGGTGGSNPGETKEKRKGIVEIFMTYWSQTVYPAALGLTLLYMTVLGFDGIGTGYGKSQGLPASLLGILRAIGGAFGVVGAILYTVSEHRIGVRKTGFFGLIAQLLALSICVGSIWLPGSPFAPAEYFQNTTAQIWWDSFKDSLSFTTRPNETETEGSKSIDWKTWTSDGHSIISAFFLLVGIAVARLGLYAADLSITQIMQEKVPEKQRGTVFGVQEALSQLFSVMKDLLVIIFPDPRTFGLLIIISVLFIMSGFLCYCYYLSKNKEICAESKSSNTTKSDGMLLPTKTPSVATAHEEKTDGSRTGSEQPDPATAKDSKEGYRPQEDNQLIKLHQKELALSSALNLKQEKTAKSETGSSNV